MAKLISINGSPIDPNPTDYEVQKQPVVKGKRNANALFIGDLIAYKDKVVLKYAMLTGDQKTTLVNSLAGFFVSLTYLNNANVKTTGNFYVSPIVAGTFEYDDVADKILYWKDVSFSLIEK